MKFLGHRLGEDAKGENNDCGGVEEEPKGCC
jgi:hypothetical protein